MLGRVNRKRLFSLLSVIWVGGISIVYWPTLTTCYHRAGIQRQSVKMEREEKEFDRCLVQHGTSREILRKKFEPECRRTYAKGCPPGGFNRWCEDEFLSIEQCIQFHSKECDSPYALTPERLVASQRIGHRVSEEALKVTMLVTDDYSPAKLPIALMFLGPLSFWFGPRFCRLLMRWLTTQ